MFDVALQAWGGSLFLLNKVFFSRAERSASMSARRLWRIRSWSVYLAGLPAWIIVFLSERNWIAAAVEAGTAPSMLVGLLIALRGHGTQPRWLDHAAKAFIALGMGLSMYDAGGITSHTQMLELGIAAGFLMGTYLMAKDRAAGYFWLMLGNVSCAALMGIQDYYILMLQQLASLLFVVDAHLARRKAFLNVQENPTSSL